MKTTLLSSAIAFALATPFAALPTDAYAASVSDSVKANKILNFDVASVPTVNQLQDSASISLQALSAEQTQAINQFKAQNPNAQVTVNALTGTVDAMIGMAIQVSGHSPENMARNFIADHQAIFAGLNIDQLQFNANRSKAALGGQVVRFEQVVNGIKVDGSGVGVVIDANNHVRGVMGPYQKDFNLASQPELSAESAVLAASQNLLQFQKDIPAAAMDVLTPAFNTIAEKLGVFQTPMPELRFVQTANGHSLVWQFYYYSTNPFGVFKYMVDAQSGEILYREDQVRTAEGYEPTDQFADYFPTFPPITAELQDNCEIIDEDGGLTARPQDLLRIKLRKFDDSNRVTGVEGVLTGKHALIGSALPTSSPFPQAALGTYYFDRDEASVYGRVDEKDHTTGSKVHFDGISQFIYITNLLEYLDYLHKEGDAVHARGFGNGSFPDQYPNESTPLVGVVHIPNVLDAPTDPSDPEFLADLLNLDNAFAIPLSQDVAGQEVVVNPTFYGHGNLFNNLAIDFSVPIHEGTHATITPIAGFEGSPEGGALNEGQADLWAYTIGETPDLGTYPVNACKLRDVLRAANVDPDSFEYIRSGQSQLRYSQLGTRGNTFEEHRDGEIYAGAMWDLRELMVQMYPANDFVRPDPVTGEATQAASLGKETWERIFLGSMYVLGVSAPDTFVKARDAVLIADAMLYPANSVDAQSLGKHHALIERVYAARELGKNAQAPLGGVQMISTAVSDFTANQAAPATPQNIIADIVGDDSINVSWDSVDGVIGYQVLKRKGGSPARLFAGVPGREYIDGDLTSNGYTHVEFVTEPSYLDKGQGFGRGAGQGIDDFDYQYVVRAIKTNATGQVGFSDLSGTAKTKLKAKNVTKQVQASISNVTFSLSEFAFDNTLTNNSAKVLFGPINFDIVSISSANVSVNNADNAGTGQRGDKARFVYNEAVSPGKDSSARNLRFDNPLAEMFSFKAKVFAKVEGQARAASGSQVSNDTSEAAAREVVYHAISEHKGLVAIGTTDVAVADGVDYVDVNFTALNSATSAVATLTADVDVGGAYPDLDFSMLDSEGNVLATSGNLGASEQVGSTVVGGETYTLRVKGYANGPTQFTIVLDQMVTDAGDASNNAASESAPEDNVFELVEFLVNPVTGTITKL
ncbi:Fungalysin/Thermolysin Propeptide Motif [Colwellia chukchiensis]|uniref:Fungalysin/Thermolysin Propeptide Motif n=1 Tax=Colwellia chukchiensis TaxID=641665 RepID=A0A1H7NVV0_9GAMM|nr:M36 family metallopeptidase [Colwellia chukchiensis]SEL27700.1 Fungalysin/Thermolysin Propeptide Motif [Colwellia chukchiensis]